MINAVNPQKSISSYIDKYNGIKKSKKKDGPGYRASRNKFSKSLRGLFWLMPTKSKLIKAIKTDTDRLPADKAEDMAFIKDQIGERKWTISNVVDKRRLRLYQVKVD